MKLLICSGVLILISLSSASLTAEEQDVILSLHNNARRKAVIAFTASDMIELEWSQGLASSAQSYAKRCTMRHSNYYERMKVTKQSGYRWVSELMYVGSTNNSDSKQDILEVAFQQWTSTSYTFDPDTFKCQDFSYCHNYRQIIWSSTQVVGCAVQKCKDDKTFVICHFAPGGNVIGGSVFKKGLPCTSCPRKYQFCNDDLCSKTSPSNTA